MTPQNCGVSLVDSYLRARNWIVRNTLPDAGIKIHHRSKFAYPEVTGYFIPTLLDWGMRERASQYVAWLLSIQNKDGSWSDPKGQSPYVFDTGQVLKGLLAYCRYRPDDQLKRAILAGCDWVVSRQQDSGRIVTPDQGAWGNMVRENVHLYVLSALVDAGKIFGVSSYGAAAEKALQFYTAQDDCFAFNQLSHFHAYVCEAFADLGRADLALRALAPVIKLIDAGEEVPAYADKSFECPTALFQLACAFYKIGQGAYGDKLFDQAIVLQNKSGGFYGSYGVGADYFPHEEISWPVKYLLDALLLKIEASFDRDFVKIAPDVISSDDGRYKFIRDSVGAARTIVDIGCGKGRFLKNLQIDLPGRAYTGIDLSSEILKFVPQGIETIKGSLLSIPVYNRTFDAVFCVEAIEHALDIDQALNEMARLVSPGGSLIIIDKRKSHTGRMTLSPWEQWCSESRISAALKAKEFKVSTTIGIPYDGRSDDLFFGTIAVRAA